MVTVSVIKADVGSIGGHTKPSARMLESVRARLREAIRTQLVLDGTVTYTGDDIAIIMSHRRGPGAAEVHHFAWDSFLAATRAARTGGLYGAGQDLLVDAPSGNLRGAGPAVAEIEFERDPAAKDRPAEAFLVFAAFTIALVRLVLQSQHRKAQTGREGLLAQRGQAESDLAPEGWVRVQGERWRARASEPVTAGETIVVEAVEGLLLRVRKGA